jgi:glycosyltransferase involved in cell wall biosynthesis
VTRIAVNTRLLLPGRLDGMGWFTYHTLRNLTHKHPEVEWHFIFDRPWQEEMIFTDRVQPVKAWPQARHPFLYYLWFEWSIPKVLKRIQADLFLSPDGYLSLSADTPQLAVMHDLNFEHYPHDLPWLTRNYYRHYFPKFAHKAARVATVSEFSKTDIARCYSIDPSKIDVVYNGVNELYQPLPETEKEKVRHEFSSGSPYFLFVGMLHQRKNIANLLRAFDDFRSRQETSIKLMIVGHRKWWTDEMESVYQAMSFRDEVIFLGRLPVETLVRVTAAARVMMYASTFEGFGVPIIEAMRCGVPVITSEVTSMPEVSGGAALLVDPFSVSSISKAMTELTSNDELYEMLAAKGQLRSREFSWDRTSELLWNSIEKCLV